MWPAGSRRRLFGEAGSVLTRLVFDGTCASVELRGEGGEAWPWSWLAPPAGMALDAEALAGAVVLMSAVSGVSSMSVGTVVVVVVGGCALE